MSTVHRMLLAAALVWGSAWAVAEAQKPAPPPPKAPAAKDATAKVTAEENYKNTCALCHGVDGTAAIKEMNFADGEWKHGSSLAAIAKTITEGVKGTAMLPFGDKFSKQEILELAKLVRSFDKTTKKAPVKK
jgi:mono/diheme cytochrome c family protein